MKESPEFDLPVLVVEDEDAVRELLVRWLAAGGFTPAAVADADAALIHLETRRAAVVLCDIRMPGRDGIWLAAAIRERHPHVAIVMSTAVADDAAVLACSRHGVLDYLTKPFGRDRLHAAVRRGLEWHRAASESRR